MKALAVFVVVLVTAAVVLLACRPPQADGTPGDTTPTTAATAPTPLALPQPLTHADATEPAARGTQMPLTQPPPAPTTTTIPTEPCAEMSWYRAAAGLPARFDAIGYRESGCDNTEISRTGCCVGWWQIHHINFYDHRTIGGLAACDATWHNIRGDNPEAKQRQACAAKVLYDVVQYQPWAATT